MTHNSNILQLLLNNRAGCGFFVSGSRQAEAQGPAPQPRDVQMLPKPAGRVGMGTSDLAGREG